MSFFKHVQLHQYDITDKGISQACYDEMKADGYDIVITEKEMQVLAKHRCEEFKNYMRPYLLNPMPDNTFIYDTVYQEFMEELQFTPDEMSEAIMFDEDRTIFDQLMERVKHTQWQDAQRLAWMQGEPPEFERRVPEDCPF